MFNLILLHSNVTTVHVQYDVIASVPFYVFLIVTLFLVYIKLNQPKYFGYLLENTVKDSEKLDSSTEISLGNLNGALLQTSFLLLISLAIWGMPHISLEKNWANFFFIVFIVFVFYIIQSIGFYLFSFIIKSGNNHFPTHRLSQNELVTIFIFVGLLLVYYLPFTNMGFTFIVLAIGFLFNLIKVSTYLTPNISTFHIILYLCTLEILPVLFLIKFFTEK